MGVGKAVAAPCPTMLCRAEEAGSWLKDLAVAVSPVGSISWLSMISHTWSNATLLPHPGPPGFQYKKKQPCSTIPLALTQDCCMLITC